MSDSRVEIHRDKIYRVKDSEGRTFFCAPTKQGGVEIGKILLYGKKLEVVDGEAKLVSKSDKENPA